MSVILRQRAELGTDWQKVIYETKNFEIGFHTGQFRGWFEHNRLGDDFGGGLWFDPLVEGELTLSDYDGVYQLPREVVDALLELRVVLHEDFMPDPAITEELP